jgi:hypothetical protein
LLSVLYSLSQTKFGENIIKNMVKIDKEGNYKIKFNNKEEITVKPDELYGKGIKTTVQGDLGIKAIEIAYGKLHNKTSKNNSFFDRSGTVM